MSRCLKSPRTIQGWRTMCATPEQSYRDDIVVMAVLRLHSERRPRTSCTSGSTPKASGSTGVR